MKTKTMERYFFFGLLLATLIFVFLIFRPFLVVLVLAASFAAVLSPVYRGLRTIRFPGWLASLLVVILFVVLLCGPLLFVGTVVFNQAHDLYQSLIHGGNSGAFVGSLQASVDRILPPGVHFDVAGKVSAIAYYISNNLEHIFSTTFSAIFSFLLTLISIFYFLKDGAVFRKEIMALSPLEEKDDQKIITKLTQAVNSVIKGYLLVAVAQGLLMWAGMSIFHVPHPALWGLVASICSLVPSVGTALVSVPGIIFLLATGHTGNAIGFTIWAALLVGMVDNFLSPLVVSGKTNIPSFLVLFSVLGGVALMGPVGILIGPLAVSLLYALLYIYRDEYRHILP